MGPVRRHQRITEINDGSDDNDALEGLAHMSSTDVITYHQGRRRNMVTNGQITARDVEFVETVAEESSLTDERILDMLAWLLANTTPAGHETVELVGLEAELEEFPNELAAHPDVLIALHQNLNLLDGLESQGAVQRQLGPFPQKGPATPTVRR